MRLLVLLSAWEWMNPVTWLNALWTALSAAVASAWVWLANLVVSTANSFMGLISGVFGSSGLGGYLPDAGTVNLAFQGIGCVNLWLPLDVVITLVGVYYTFRGVLLGYRFIKSWLPGLSG